jgi:hypothetical protein
VSSASGGNIHAQWICQQLGYRRVNQQGGTCGNTCSYCTAGSSCAAPGAKSFTGGGAGTADEFGPQLCCTVMWECAH